MVDSNNITTFMRWPGSKWRIADWIIAHFPDDHGVYCEPFFGSGAVFFRKMPSGTETINDIDGNVVNLFRVIRDAADDLCKKIEMTPYARAEYRASFDLSCDDDIERARRFWSEYGRAMAVKHIATRHGHIRESIAYFVQSTGVWCRIKSWLLYHA